MLAGLTDGLGWIKHIVLIIDDWATSRKMAYRRDQGTAMPNSIEYAVATVEQRRIGALIAFDITVLDEIIDGPYSSSMWRRGRSPSTFLRSTSTTSAPSERPPLGGTYRDIVRMRGKPTPLKHARHLRVYVNRGGSWKLVAPQATEIAPRST